jgi:hypothetical protein
MAKLFDCDNCRLKLKCILRGQKEKILNKYKFNKTFQEIIKLIRKGKNPYTKGLYVGYYIGTLPVPQFGTALTIQTILADCILEMVRRDIKEISDRWIREGAVS